MNYPRNQVVHHMIEGMTAQQELEKQKTAEELADAIGSSRDVLIRAKTVFPFKIFPTIVAVDRTKITITEREAFKSGEVLSMRFEDVLNITVHVNPILGSIKISSRFFNPEKPYVVDCLRRADALKIKRIVQGYLIARHQDIDTSNLPTKELAAMLDKLGKVPPAERV
jgi:hypothetical protein